MNRWLFISFFEIILKLVIKICSPEFSGLQISLCISLSVLPPPIRVKRIPKNSVDLNEVGEGPSSASILSTAAEKRVCVFLVRPPPLPSSNMPPIPTLQDQSLYAFSFMSISVRSPNTLIWYTLSLTPFWFHLPFPQPPSFWTDSKILCILKQFSQWFLYFLILSGSWFSPEVTAFPASLMRWLMYHWAWSSCDGLLCSPLLLPNHPFPLFPGSTRLWVWCQRTIH